MPKPWPPPYSRGDMAYWWEGEGSERYWVEIRWVEGIGRFLTCPAPPVDGRTHNPWYQLVGQVQPDDVIYHWNAVEHRFVGRSRVASSVRQEVRIGLSRSKTSRHYVCLCASLGFVRWSGSSRPFAIDWSRGTEIPCTYHSSTGATVFG